MFKRTTTRKAILALVAVAAALALAGCSQNQSPVAEAGAAQQVTTNSTVTLDASGSSDPNGDSLIYSWSVASGPSISLSDPNAAQPTFTAPDEPVTIVFELSVKDGAGGSSTDTAEITVVPPVTLLIANYGSDSVLGFQDPSSLNGNVAPDQVLLEPPRSRATRTESRRSDRRFRWCPDHGRRSGRRGSGAGACRP
jgi:hypothetical protein